MRTAIAVESEIRRNPVACLEMSGSRMLGIIALLAAVLSPPSCWSCPPCEQSTLTSRLVSGGVTYTVGIDPPQQRELTTQGTTYPSPVADRCLIGGLRTVLTKGGQVSYSGPGPVIVCGAATTAGIASLEIHIGPLQDLRPLTVAEASRAAPQKVTPAVAGARSGTAIPAGPRM